LHLDPGVNSIHIYAKLLYEMINRFGFVEESHDQNQKENACNPIKRKSLQLGCRVQTAL